MTATLSEGTAPGAPDGPLSRPRLADDVVLHEPSDERPQWILQRGTRQYFRIAPDLARLLQAMDGRRDRPGLAEHLGAPWTEGDVSSAVVRLTGQHVLDDGKPVRRRRESRFRFVPPMTLQVTLLKPERLLRRVSAVVRPLTRRAGAIGVLAVVAAGVAALAVQAAAVTAALGSPLPLGVYLAVVAGVLLTTAVHEFGHGLVLTHFGGRPSRMGFMLFYGSPAFFCDVSDGWLLSRKQYRVAVALAGVVTQTGIAALAAISALFVSAETPRAALLVFAVASYVTGVLNLMPFVKLDGYIALMSHLDIPHLRDRAMTDARRWLARILFGGTYRRELPELSWSIPFGLACMAFPIYIVAGAMALWLDVFTRLGAVGAMLVLSGVGYLLYFLGRGFARLIGEARSAGGRLPRIVVVTAALLAILVAIVSVVRVPTTISGGYTITADGRARLVLPTSVNPDALRAGTPVTLYRSGVMLREEIAQGVLAGSEPSPTTASISAFLPVRTDAFPLPAEAVPIDLRSPAPGEDDATGTARLETGTSTVAQWAFSTYVAPAFRW